MLSISTALLSGCASTTCTEVGCAPHLQLDGVPFEGSVAGATATGCRNGVCVSGVLSDSAAPSSGTEVFGGDFVVHLGMTTGGRSAAIDVAAGSTLPETFADGDVYTLSIVAADGTELVSGTWTVDYETTRPNGPLCPPECAVGRARE